MARQRLPDVVDGGGIDATRLGDAFDHGLGARVHVLVLGQPGHRTLLHMREGEPGVAGPGPISAFPAISATGLRTIRRLADRFGRFGRLPFAAGVSAISAGDPSLWWRRARILRRSRVALAGKSPKSMTMIPILVMRVSACIRHNIAQDCQ